MDFRRQPSPDQQDSMTENHAWRRVPQHYKEIVSALENSKKERDVILYNLVA